MLVYTLATISSFLIAVFFNITSRGKNNRLFIKVFISLLPLTVVSAIRYGVGWDYFEIYTYGFYYNSIPGKQYFGETVFNIFNKIIYVFTTNVDWLFIICSLIIAIYLSMAIKQQSKSIVMSILLVFFSRYFFLSMNIVRQGIAMSIILYSLKYIKYNNIKKYVFNVILAGSIHNVALLFLPFYFIGKIDFTKSHNKFLIILSPAIILLGQKILLKFIEGTKYINYFGSKFDGSDFLFTEIIINILVLMYGIANYKKKNDEYFYIYFNMQIIACIISILSKFIPVADRIIWYFSIQNILFIPLILKNYKREHKLIHSTIIFLSLGIIVIMQTLLTDSYSILPYNTIFNKL